MGAVAGRKGAAIDECTLAFGDEPHSDEAGPHDRNHHARALPAELRLGDEGSAPSLLDPDGGGAGGGVVKVAFGSLSLATLGDNPAVRRNAPPMSSREGAAVCRRLTQASRRFQARQIAPTWRTALSEGTIDAET